MCENLRSMIEQHSSHLRKNRCLPASSLKPEERELVVDCRASMHIISKKHLSDAEMDTLTKLCSPTIVTYANGEVQTHEEATVYVEALDIFLTMKVLENTPAVLTLGKLCDEKGYSYEWINGQKLIKNAIRTPCNTENFVPIVVQVRPLDLHRLPRHLRDRRVIPHHLLQAHLLHLQSVSTSIDDRSGQPDETQANKIQKPN